MGQEKKSRALPFFLLTMNFYLLAIAGFSAAINSIPQPRLWQVFFKLQLSGSYHCPMAEIEGNYSLEADWLGFLEEDGLDFIIYHLGPYPIRWEITEKTPAGIFTNMPSRSSKNFKLCNLPPPELQMEYIQGGEKEIRVYYSLKNLPVPISPSYQRSEFWLYFPSVPWKQTLTDESKIKKKIIGQKIISLPRSRLESKECQEDFSWREEITTMLQGRPSFFQRHEVRVRLRIVSCEL